jgi:hypothetical protein
MTGQEARAKGRAAARRGSDLDAAESRFLRRYGHEHINAWLAGWSSWAAGEA